MVDAVDKTQGDMEDKGEGEEKGKPQASQGEENKQILSPPSDTPGTGIMVPKHRLDSVSSRLKTVSQENQELRDKLEQAGAHQHRKEEPVTLDSMEERIKDLDAKAVSASSDGDFEAQSKFLSEARNIERNINRLVSENTAAIVGTRAVQDMQLNVACEELVKQYPVLDPDKDSFDDDLSEEILEIYESFKANTGMKLSLADKMRRAVSLVVKDGASSDSTNKLTTNKTKNLKDAGSIPANLDKVGADHDKAGNGNRGLDILTMSEEEFDKLSESDKSALRGDIFA